MNLPTKNEVLDILKSHPLVKFNGKVLNMCIVGSYAAGKQTDRSDIDILIKVPRRKISSDELEEKYRNKLRSYFIKNNIKGIAEHVHPNYNGKRIDIYFTYEDRDNNCIKL